MSGQHRTPAGVTVVPPFDGRSWFSEHVEGGRDLADPALWSRSAAWAQQRRVSVPAQRRNERRRRKMALAMSVAMVGGSAAPTLSAATAATSGDVPGATDNGTADGPGATTLTVADDATTRAMLVAGSTGPEVRDLQSRLGVVADGHFGTRTIGAVQRFQRDRSLVVDGIVGPQTWTALLSGGRAAVRSTAATPTLKVVSAQTRADGSQDLVLVGPVERPGATTVNANLPAADGPTVADGRGDGAAADRADGGAGNAEPSDPDGEATGTTGRSSSTGSSAGSGSTTGASGPTTKPAAATPSAGAKRTDGGAATDGTPNGTEGRAPATSADGTVRPMATGSLSSSFGPRSGRLHAGIDIAAPIGTTIRAYAAGTVAFSGTQDGYGNIVCLDHGNGLQTCYAHMSKNAVAKGTKVQAGDTVGYVGMTGRTTGPHLHFEVRKNGSAVNPASYWNAAGQASASARTTVAPVAASASGRTSASARTSPVGDARGTAAAVRRSGAAGTVQTDAASVSGWAADGAEAQAVSAATAGTVDATVETAAVEVPGTAAASVESVGSSPDGSGAASEGLDAAASQDAAPSVDTAPEAVPAPDAENTGAGDAGVGDAGVEAEAAPVEAPAEETPAEEAPAEVAPVEDQGTAETAPEAETTESSEAESAPAADPIDTSETDDTSEAESASTAEPASEPETDDAPAAESGGASAAESASSDETSDADAASDEGGEADPDAASGTDDAASTEPDPAP